MSTDQPPGQQSRLDHWSDGTDTDDVDGPIVADIPADRRRVYHDSTGCPFAPTERFEEIAEHEFQDMDVSQCHCCENGEPEQGVCGLCGCGAITEEMVICPRCLSDSPIARDTDPPRVDYSR